MGVSSVPFVCVCGERAFCVCVCGAFCVCVEREGGRAQGGGPFLCVSFFWRGRGLFGGEGRGVCLFCGVWCVCAFFFVCLFFCVEGCACFVCVWCVPLYVRCVCLLCVWKVCFFCVWGCAFFRVCGRRRGVLFCVESVCLFCGEEEGRREKREGSVCLFFVECKNVCVCVPFFLG